MANRGGGGDCAGREPGGAGRRRRLRVCDVTANFAGQLCGGDRLRQRRCWQRDLFAGADRRRTWRPGCLRWMRRTPARRRRRHRPGRGDRAQPGRQRDHRLGGRDQLLHDRDRPGDGRGDVHRSTATTSGTRTPASDDDTADADAGERRPAAAGADGDRCRRRQRHGGDQSGRRRVPDRGRRSGCGCGESRLRRRLCWTRARWRRGRRRRPAVCDGDGELCRQLCGGNGLRQRRCLAARPIRWC